MSDSVIETGSKTRFCPSPTGLLHLGNVRTALFNALLAKSAEGTFLLRIEDTDPERSKEEFTKQLQHDLLWLGLIWNEGPGVGGNLGPYHQSGRQDLYDDYYQRLELAGTAYPCFCSEDQLALARKIQRSSGKPPRYLGTCCKLSDVEVQQRIAAGDKPTLRFKVPDNEVVKFHDLVRGDQQFKSDDIGDFIIRRANGTSPFMFCNAIDDAMMGVTHVMRGEDHLTNTPRQIMILEALGLTIPTYAHIALIVGPDNKPLSKRTGSRSIQALSQSGYLPMAINNYLARLGHYYGNDEYLTLEQLAQQFKVSALSKSPAKYNPEQLDFWQKMAVSQLNDADFWQWVGDATQALVPAAHQENFIAVVKPNCQFPEDAKQWADIIFGTSVGMKESCRDILKSAGKEYFTVADEALCEYGLDFSKITSEIKSRLKIKGKALYQPLRIALTGQEHGPEMAKVLCLMEHAEIKKRLEVAQHEC